jgi:Spy/CpxP family protein refolding chaperone
MLANKLIDNKIRVHQEVENRAETIAATATTTATATPTATATATATATLSHVPRKNHTLHFKQCSKRHDQEIVERFQV